MVFAILTCNCAFGQEQLNHFFYQVSLMKMPYEVFKQFSIVNLQNWETLKTPFHEKLNQKNFLWVDLFFSTKNSKKKTFFHKKNAFL